VIENGGIVQAGTPAEVTARPRSQYVADLVGMNLLRGMARGTTIQLDDGGQVLVSEAAAGPVFAVIPPSAVSVHRGKPETTTANVWSGQVAGVDLMGDRVRVRVDGQPTLSAEVPPSAVDELKLDDAGVLWTAVEPSAVTVYPS